MSMIPAELSAMQSVTGTAAGGIRRLPRALGWLSAAVVSAGFWGLAVEAIRLVS
ncbi:hypothetical protein [Caulobacter sp. DWR1-3-2b1]|uniref:hypothetical protein n=1 Tax=Caulobacter sp. DWR1-3-2b1 TaxID=2804670 RepID=UPI003CEEAEDA